jgi:hypothetical protein
MQIAERNSPPGRATVSASYMKVIQTSDKGKVVVLQSATPEDLQSQCLRRHPAVP